MINPYTKERVESLRLFPYTSVNVRVALKISVVNGQHQKELVKVLTCGHSCDYQVNGSDTPLPEGS